MARGEITADEAVADIIARYSTGTSEYSTSPSTV
jgi:hypothetical protein